MGDSDNITLASMHSISKGFYGECGRRGGYLELMNVDADVVSEFYKLASINLCSNLNGQICMALVMNPPKVCLSGDIISSTIAPHVVCWHLSRILHVGLFNSLIAIRDSRRIVRMPEQLAPVPGSGRVHQCQAGVIEACSILPRSDLLLAGGRALVQALRRGEKGAAGEPEEACDQAAQDPQLAGGSDLH